MSGPERRELVVAGALVRHQMRQYLRLHDIRYHETLGDSPGETTFHITATPPQWEAINQWVEKVKQ
jgi:hypothetical protein